MIKIIFENKKSVASFEGVHVTSSLVLAVICLNLVMVMATQLGTNSNKFKKTSDEGILMGWIKYM